MASDAAVSAPSGRTAWARNLGAPIRGFLEAETGGAVVLVVAAVLALLWANSPWPDSYESFWTTDLAIRIGDHTLSLDLRDWVNQGLMTLFFLVVGLEAKRELDLGELRERQRIAIPVVAGLGGMAAAVGIYLAFNAGGPGASGWGTAMSTDTALALGALALVSRGRATRLRVFLLTVVVIDDLVALLIISVAYSNSVDLAMLAVAVGLFGVLLSLRFVPGSWRGPIAVLVGVVMWVALHASGIDPIIAGLAAGLVISAYPPARSDLERTTELARSFREQPTPELAYSARSSLTAAISANDRLQYRLHPWTSRVIVPLFALANAGIHLDGTLLRDAASSPVTMGILTGYVVGKPLGIVSASWVASRCTGLRPTVTWPILASGGAFAGMGFTVSLLVASLAFHGALLEQAKIGVLATVIVAPLVGWTIIRIVNRLPDSVRARQLGRVAGQIVDLAEDVDPERDHIRGNPDAPVTLVEYGDFECPYCRAAEPIVRDLLAGVGSDLRYVFRHLPLSDVHANAQLAAEAAEAAAAQGAFWEMHDELFAHQDELTPPELVGHAGRLGLDVERFEHDLRHHRHAPRVAEDVASADASGVSGTPTFFINGRRHQGVYDIDTLTRAVKTAAARAPRVRETAAATRA
jgi:Na+/H+ antiporter NhaA